VAVSDVTGGTYCKDGLDVQQLAEHVKATGGVKGFAGGEDVSFDAVLEADCDVLIPAAALQRLPRKMPTGFAPKSSLKVQMRR